MAGRLTLMNSLLQRLFTCGVAMSSDGAIYCLTGNSTMSFVM